MSDSTRPIAALGYATDDAEVENARATTLQILPSAAIRPMVRKQPEKSPEK